MFYNFVVIDWHSSGFVPNKRLNIMPLGQKA
jgi:hypothetical protein